MSSVRKRCELRRRVGRKPTSVGGEGGDGMSRTRRTGRLLTTFAGAALVVSGQAGVGLLGSVTPARAGTPVSCGPSIAYGQVMPCSISAPNEVDSIAFSGHTGDVVRLHIVAQSTLKPTVQVRTLRMAECDATNLGDSNCTLTHDGAHSIRVRDPGSGTGNYFLYIQRLNAPVGCASIGFAVIRNGPASISGAVD